VRPGECLARELVDGAGEPLGEPAAVHEDERRGVGANELDQPRMNRAPHRCPFPGAVTSLIVSTAIRFFDHLDPQAQRLPCAGVDDRHRPELHRPSPSRELTLDVVCRSPAGRGHAATAGATAALGDKLCSA
jgi:hypothetical protein